MLSALLGIGDDIRFITIDNPRGVVSSPVGDILSISGVDNPAMVSIDRSSEYLPEGQRPIPWVGNRLDIGSRFIRFCSVGRFLDDCCFEFHLLPHLLEESSGFTPECF